MRRHVRLTILMASVISLGLGATDCGGSPARPDGGALGGASGGGAGGSVGTDDGGSPRTPASMPEPPTLACPMRACPMAGLRPPSWGPSAWRGPRPIAIAIAPAASWRPRERAPAAPGSSASVWTAWRGSPVVPARWRPPAAAQCLADVALGPCVEGPFAEPPSCAEATLLAPRAAVGAPCDRSSDCVAGVCRGPTTACHVCVGWAALGSPCGLVDHPCDPAQAFCEDPADGGDRRCAALKGASAPCAEHRECAAGWCNWASLADAGPDTCGHLPVGAACGDPGDCERGAWCAGYAYDGLTLTPGTCAPRLALGSTCVHRPDDDGCADAGWCQDGRCTARPRFTLDAGQQCLGLGQCASSLYCRGFADLAADGGAGSGLGVCAARQPPGAPCSFSVQLDADCADGLVCGAASQCVARADVGQACASSAECLDLLACPGATGVCEPWRQVGDVCAAGARCVAGLRDGRCVADGGSPMCSPRLADGASCDPFEFGACASGRCVASGAPGPVCTPACFP